MGLGPSICATCRIFVDYIPHEEPGKQGDWVCPINQYHDQVGLFMIPEREWPEIYYETDVVRFYLRGHSDEKVS